MRFEVKPAPDPPALAGVCSSAAVIISSNLSSRIDGGRPCRGSAVKPSSRDFCAISAADRKHAAKNPKAYFYEKPITIEDHQNSRWIAEPLRRLDCCRETDGAVAIVVTSVERAKDLKHRPEVIEAAAQACSPDQYTMVSYYRPELDGLHEMGLVGKQLWQQSGLKSTDIQTAILYDHFTLFILISVVNQVPWRLVRVVAMSAGTRQGASSGFIGPQRLPCSTRTFRRRVDLRIGLCRPENSSVTGHAETARGAHR